MSMRYNRFLTYLFLAAVNRTKGKFEILHKFRVFWLFTSKISGLEGGYGLDMIDYTHRPD